MGFLLTLSHKIVNMLAIPNVRYLLLIIAMAFLIRLLYRKFSPLRTALVIATTAFLVIYLGPLAFAELTLTLVTGLVLGRRYLPHLSLTLQLNAGTFLVFTAYVALVHLLNQFWIPRYLLLSGGLLILLASRPQSFSRSLSSLSSDLADALNSLNLADLVLLITIFCLSTLPQTHWDAAQANLYIAKWYTSLNSFTPLPEATSSLFPQAGNIYYSWFAVRGARFLGFGIFFPVLGLIALCKSVIRHFSLPTLAQIIIYAALTLPIVIFQGSNGYYDLLTLDVVFTAIILLTEAQKPYLLSIFLLGLAGTFKLFPLMLLPLPVLLYLKENKLSYRKVTKLILVLSAALTPVLLYSLRSYHTTGSPIFPFFQQFFPTPGFWSPNVHLEQFASIQSPLTLTDWLVGGFALYPFFTFFNTSAYMEATPFYVGAIYMFTMPLQLVILLVSVKQVLSRSVRHPLYLVNLGAFLGYLLIGCVARYYRYMWPYQFTWLVTSLIILTQKPFTGFVQRISQKKYLNYVLSLIFVGNFYWLISYYRFYPIFTSRLFRPDYFFTSQDNSDPTIFLNSRLKENDLILDSSTYLLPRINFKSRVFQCNWYYLQGTKKIGRTDPVTNFRFLITDIPPNPDNYCTKYITPLLSANTYHQIYQDNYYAIYEKNE